MKIEDFILNVLLTSFAYLIVPFITMISNRKYSKSTLRKIIIINGIAIWLLFMVLSIELNNEPTTGASGLLWCAIGYGILKKKCLLENDNKQDIILKETTHIAKKEKVEPVINNGIDLNDFATTQKYCPYCLEPVSDTQKVCKNCKKYIC